MFILREGILQESDELHVRPWRPWIANEQWDESDEPYAINEPSDVQLPIDVLLATTTTTAALWYSTAISDANVAIVATYDAAALAAHQFLSLCHYRPNPAIGHGRHSHSNAGHTQLWHRSLSQVTAGCLVHHLQLARSSQPYCPGSHEWCQTHQRGNWSVHSHLPVNLRLSIIIARKNHQLSSSLIIIIITNIMIDILYYLYSNIQTTLNIYFCI